MKRPARRRTPNSTGETHGTQQHAPASGVGSAAQKLRRKGEASEGNFRGFLMGVDNQSLVVYDLPKSTRSHTMFLAAFVSAVVTIVWAAIGLWFYDKVVFGYHTKWRKLHVFGLLIWVVISLTIVFVAIGPR
jgi:hypothetical protein